jgi:DNA-binding response OmpR family regulator
VIGNRILIFNADTVEKPRLSGSLNLEGYAVVLCSDVGRTIELLQQNTFAAALIFLCPGDSGLDLMTRLGAATTPLATPILIATPSEALDVRLRGLELGARDYLIQPFETDQLLARIVTTVRRQPQTTSSPKRRKMTLDVSNGRIGDGSQWAWLTPTERQAFALLFKHRQQAVSKDRLKAALSEGVNMTDNAIGVMIYRLRTKVRALGMDIHARRRIGYILEDNDLIEGRIGRAITAAAR